MVRSNGAEERENGGVQVIARAAAILRALQRNPRGLSFSQLAREVKLARSTVHRIVSALVAERFVSLAGANGLIRLGSGLTPLAAAVNSDLRRHLHPYLEWLYNEVNETVDLALFADDQVCFIDQIAAPHRLQAVSAVGVTFPLHCTANGKAFLAALLPDSVAQLLPAELVAFTPNTIRTHERLLTELTQIQTDGVAFDREEHTLGICAVGMALRTPLDEWVAITIPVPSQRFYGNETKLVTALRTVIGRIRQNFD